VAGLLGITIGTVKSTASRAIAQLREFPGLAATDAVLESTVTYPPGSDMVTPQDPAGNGTVVETTVYLAVTWASTVPGNPYRG
jgi:hypothetical protein